tara:strand:- start:1981 stop:2619 length:639 start_codon:yes stop_codon:yes gene_type:complete
MVTNAYINNTTYTQEQDLIGSLVIESIQMHGQDFTYIPRTIVKEDTIFNEDTVSSFTNAYTVEMYIDSVEGFEGEGEMLSQFGLNVSDQLITTVSKTRFTTETSMSRPKVGDLIYLPLVDKAFEIKFVEDEVPFFQLGKMHVFQLTTELFEYSHETVNTGIVEIDNNFSDAQIADDTIDNQPDVDTGLTPLSPAVTDGVIDFTTTNPFSEDY